MQLSPIGTRINGIGSAGVGVNDAARAAKAAKEFRQALESTISQVDALQKQSDLSAQRLAMGETEDVHQAVIASERATLGLQLAIAVRNKAIEAYQEIMRMQV